MALRNLQPSDRSCTAKARERFFSGVQDEALLGARPEVELSWRRCREFDVNPELGKAPLAAGEDALFGLKQQHAELIEAFLPVVAQAHTELEEFQAVMVLTDPSGIVLWTEGDASALEAGQDIRLMPGGHWVESEMGTNGIGTALAFGKPVHIRADEHFCEAGLGWSCAATVIRDPYDGSILGALDISGLAGNHDQRWLSLAELGAVLMESRLALIDLQKRNRLYELALSKVRRSSQDGLILFDRKGRMIRADTAARRHLAEIGREPGQWRGNVDPEPVYEGGEKLGALLVVPKPRRAARAAEPPPAPIDAIIGDSPALADAKKRARRLASLRVPVLLQGPTGTGKEVFAQAIHAGGARKGAPFIAMNCTAVTRELLASELFGHVEGAFTGALRGGLAGKFEAAHGGTFFLDEIGEMPLDLQAMLLRVLEVGEVSRLGETSARKVDVRIIAATNRDLQAEVQAGRFRSDLYFRLAVARIELPALAERKEDIPALVRHFIARAAERHGVAAKQPTAGLLRALQTRGWPGNLRELRNCIETMLLLGEAEMLSEEDLPAAITHWRALGTPPSRLADGERRMILDAIEKNRGNLRQAAAQLAIARSTLYEKMKRYGIERTESVR